MSGPNTSNLDETVGKCNHHSDAAKDVDLRPTATMVVICDAHLEFVNIFLILVLLAILLKVVDVFLSLMVIIPGFILIRKTYGSLEPIIIKLLIDKGFIRVSHQYF